MIPFRRTGPCSSLYLVALAAGIFIPSQGIFAAESTGGMTNFYVDNALSSSGNGLSWSSAWNSFSDIDWARVKPGDTVYISGGSSSETYDETLTIDASGVAGKPITITAGIDPGHDGKVIIDAQETRENGVAVYDQNYVDVQHLSVRNATSAGISVRGATAGVTIEHNDVYSGDPGGGNARGYDVRNCSGMGAVIIRDNSFSTPASTTAQTDGAWSSNNDGVIFKNNHFVISNSDTSGHSDGIQSFEDHNIVISGNWIEQANHAPVNNHGIWVTNIHTGGIVEVYDNVVLAPNLTGDTDVGFSDTSDWKETGTIHIDSNTILGGDRALLFQNVPTTVEAHNNILSPAGGRYGVAIWTQSSPIPGKNIDNNLIWAPAGHIASVEQQGGTKDWAGWQALGYDEHGVHANPGFVDSGANDYELSPHSPAVDRGATLSDVTIDFAGTPRPQGAAYDIGAYEFRPGPTSPGSQPSSSETGAHAGSGPGPRSGSGPSSPPSSAVDAPSERDPSIHLNRHDHHHGGVTHGSANASRHMTGIGLVGGGGDEMVAHGSHADTPAARSTPGFSPPAKLAGMHTADGVIEQALATGRHGHVIAGIDGANANYGSNADDSRSHGNSTPVIGTHLDTLTGDGAHDTFVLSSFQDHGSVIADVNPDADVIDLHRLTTAIGYTADGAVGDGHLAPTTDPHAGTVVGVTFDSHPDRDSAHSPVTLQHVLPTAYHESADPLWH